MNASETIADLYEGLGVLTGASRRPWHDLRPAASLRGMQIDAGIAAVTVPDDVEETPFAQRLRLDWEQTEAAIDEAQKRFRETGNVARFRAEMAEIRRAS